MKTPFYRIAGLVGLILAVVVGVSACGGGDAGTAAPTDTSGSAAVTSLVITDTLVGTGAVAGNGSVVSINYTGWLYDRNAVGFRGKDLCMTHVCQQRNSTNFHLFPRGTIFQ